MKIIIHSLLLSLLSIQFVMATTKNDVKQTQHLQLDDPKAISQGKILYEQACAACHSRDLGGAFGFNLKDGEWIHGSEPQQVVQNIKKGFSSAGMPGFDSMFSTKEIKSMVAYIFSKREGFNNLSFKLYQMKDANDRVISSDKLIKSGRLANNLADFQLPEVQHYIIEFEGNFYTPKNEPTRAWVQWGANTNITFEIDGEVVERDNRFGEWFPTWPFKQGKQQLKITYRSADDKPHMKNLTLIVTNDDMGIKLFPVSTRAKAIMLGKKLELKATSQPIVQRVKTMNLPTYSIAVGFPQKINFAFNTRHCSVVGLWQGDMLNIGPNIAGRGEDASLPLGEWIFHFPSSLQLQQEQPSQCQYLGYHLVAGTPEFLYKIDDAEYHLLVSANNNKTIDFHYTAVDLANSSLQFKLPKAENLLWTSPHGKVTDEYLHVTSDAFGKFIISAQYQ
ncbi:c-type cytochrome [Paraglaciecola arctica]|uniref:c-type cytochrome n=1 Tax=Paraglaciecola arctica TaxID=1128911 RepID=UPI001C069746|nr:c-type cytochrome [Paraglaciecola arctica]MBU3005360.1 cytochrome c [Paraglaciecola arctica]